MYVTFVIFFFAAPLVGYIIGHWEAEGPLSAGQPQNGSSGARRRPWWLHRQHKAIFYEYACLKVDPPPCASAKAPRPRHIKFTAPATPTGLGSMYSWEAHASSPCTPARDWCIVLLPVIVDPIPTLFCHLLTYDLRILSFDSTRVRFMRIYTAQRESLQPGKVSIWF
jgi:hypothetical protein